MTPSINFTVPLTARVLRAILADMEGTGTLLGGCGCHAGDSVKGDLDRDIKLRAAGMVAERLAPGQDANGYVAPAVIAANPFQPTDLLPLGTLLVDGVPVQPIYAEPMPVLPIYPNPAATSIDTMVTPFVPTPPTIPMPPVVTPPVAPVPPCPPGSMASVAASKFLVTGVVAGVKVDGEGLPWDKRIHASTKTFRQSDNTWKLLKGIDPALVASVKAELRACMAAPAPGVVAALSGSYSPATGHVVGLPDPRFDGLVERDNAVTALITASAVPLPPIVPAPPAPPVVQEAVITSPATGITFEQFCTWVTGKMAAKELSRPQLEKACADNGITSLPMLQNRPDLVPVIHRFLESICFPASSVGGE